MLNIINHQLQIKTTIRYHFTSTRRLIITKHKCWQRCAEKKTLVHCWWDCRLVQPLWKTVWTFLKKLEVHLPFDPVIPFPGIYPENPEKPIQKNICTSMFIAALLAVANIQKQLKCSSVDEWIKKLWHIYTMEYHMMSKRGKFYLLHQQGWTWRLLC